MSTGGFVGMRLALRAPELIRSLSLIDTSAAAEDPAVLKQNSQMLFVARWVGTRPLQGKVVPIMFAEPFRTSPDTRDALNFWREQIFALDKRSVHRFGKAIFSRDSVLDDLAALSNPHPTQIIVGAADVATQKIKKNSAGLKHQFLRKCRFDPGSGYRTGRKRFLILLFRFFIL